MNTFLKHTAILWVSQLALGLIFVIASVEKIAIPNVFAANVQAYQLIPLPLVNIFSLIIPWTELVCGLLLMSGVRVRASAATLSGLLIIFIFAILIAMARGLNIDCGCFGSAHATPVGWNKVIEDIGMLLLGVHLFFYAKKENDAELSRTQQI